MKSTETDTAATHEINLPFSGFYQSIWDQALDYQAECFAEYEAERTGADVLDIADLVFRYTDGNAMLSICHAYPERLADALADEGGPGIRLSFARKTSPRFYNFETDRIFAHISEIDVLKLYRISADDEHKTLAAKIRERFTPRSGFIPFYSANLQTWQEKPLNEWDANELGTLVIAVIELTTGDTADELERSICDEWPDGLYHEWSEGIEWDKLHPAIESLKRAA